MLWISALVLYQIEYAYISCIESLAKSLITIVVI